MSRARVRLAVLLLAVPAAAADFAVDGSAVSAAREAAGGMPSVAGSPVRAAAAFEEEPDSFTLPTKRGPVQIAIEPAGREARRRLHAEREKALGAREFVRFADGELRGAVKTTGNKWQPWQVWAYELNEKGSTTKAVLSGGTVDDKPAVLLTLYAGERATAMIGLTATSTVLVSRD